MEVITTGWPDDNQVLLSDIKMTYIQNPDCTEGRDGDPQELTISTRDNGVAKFINVSTNNWSIDNNQDLEYVINDFKRRIDYDKQKDEYKD